MINEYQSKIKHMPIPYFEIDKEMNILAQSDKSVETFCNKGNFLDIVDLESREKALIFLVSKKRQQEIELVLQTAHSPYSLFSCSIHWNEGIGYLVCIEQTDKLKNLESKIEKQCKRLAETNFELLEQKEQLEQSLKRILELSAHFIKLSDSVGLVPLTGELNPELIRENHLTLTNIAHDGKFTMVFFDFSSVGKLTSEGIESFSQLIHSLNLVGVICYVIGLKPEHAVYLKNKGLNKKTYFMRNLDEIIQVDLEYNPQKNSIMLH
ncbi:hypothetical protein M1K46_16845 [Fictibacillus sp. WQ 8-8]|uniref:hypothetical protein n=1 Tax=Fictibacillus sp. WQ 8-8 TaxID=2938788 RepID=UPI00210CC631|nr:hypothetical protein [Fictibacillus sp. WQ 8-8]MCQ6267306.1 hypothetical protein [Fictibacillus sp. WQ 8-8]